MTAKGKYSLIHQIFDLFLIIIVVTYVVPAAKHALFPTQMTRIEKMLRNSTLKGYDIAVDRKDEFKIVLTVFDGDKSISAEIYRDVLQELDPEGEKRIFFTHAINDNSEQVVYLSRVRMETDAKLEKLLHIEITICGRIRNQTGKVQYDGYEPVYECEVPIKKIVVSGED
jgi:hypothetical protein